MNILFLYGTNSSGTAVVAETITQHLTTAGHQVTLRHARDTTPDVLTAGAELIILGSCTWERFSGDGKRLEGELQQHMYSLVESATPPTGQRFALVGLGDSSYTEFCAAAQHLEDVVARWQGQLILPTLRIDSYFFDLKKNRLVVDAWATELVKKLTT